LALDDLFVLIMLGGFIVGIAIVSIHSKRKKSQHKEE